MAAKPPRFVGILAKTAPKPPVYCAVYTVFEYDYYGRWRWYIRVWINFVHAYVGVWYGVLGFKGVGEFGELG